MSVIDRSHSRRKEDPAVVRFDSFFLLRVRKEAMRKGVWFRVLGSTERAILNLVPRCMEMPKSAKLIGILADIIVKVKGALQSKIAVLTRQVGEPLACRLSGIARKWGHRTAWEWTHDRWFARFLAVMAMNDGAVSRYGPVSRASLTRGK